MLNGKNILITGGTGSFGYAFTNYVLSNYKPNKLVIFSRDEMKQWEMQKIYSSDDRVRFFIGDVRDKDRLSRALSGIDFVIHAAATKIVPTAEYNPFECVKTNVTGAMNLIDAAIDQNVSRVVALSTDKASSPANLYGATKLVSDKLFIAGNAYSPGRTQFAVVRYGNVMGSRGSIIPLFSSQKNDGFLTITDVRMTRFMITLEQGVGLVLHALSDMVGGEVYVKKIPSIKITDIAEAINPLAKIKIVGTRPGEKIHEEMISSEDARLTFEYDEYYKILPALNDWYKDENRIKNGKIVQPGFRYASDTNTEWMSAAELAAWVEKNNTSIGRI